MKKRNIIKGTFLILAITLAGGCTNKKSSSESEASTAPTAKALGVALTDTNATANALSGTIRITKATDESSLTSYAVYLGSESSPKATLVADIAKTGSNLSYATTSALTYSETTAYLLSVYTKNGGTESQTPVQAEVFDATATLPTFTASTMTFADEDYRSGYVEGYGIISYGKPDSTNSSGSNRYQPTGVDAKTFALFWGSDASTKLAYDAWLGSVDIDSSQAITEFFFTEPVSIPTGATHILACPQNENEFAGEGASCGSVAISDSALTDGRPTFKAAGVSFQDEDTDTNEISGTIKITKAADETSITHYTAYFADENGKALTGGAIGSPVAKTGSDVTVAIGANTAIPQYAKSISVYTKNATGEMPVGKAVWLEDLKGTVPTVVATSGSFTDVDPKAGKIAGTLKFTSPVETTITGYSLYFGSSETSPIGNKEVTALGLAGGASTAVNFEVPPGTDLPAGVTHVLIYTKNQYGRATTPLAVAITDVVASAGGAPANIPGKIEFEDIDMTAGKVGGVIKIKKASDETDITHYVVYYSTNDFTAKTSLTEVTKTGADLSITVSPSVDYVAGLKLMVVTKNATAEAAAGPKMDVEDKVIETITGIGGSQNYVLVLNKNGEQDAGGESIGTGYPNVSLYNLSPKSVAPAPAPAIKDLQFGALLDKPSKRVRPYAAPSPITSCTAGSTQATFNAQSKDEQSIEVTATCQCSGTYAYIFVKNGEESATNNWASVCTAFDSLYTSVTTTYGNPTDIDKNGKLVILYYGMAAAANAADRNNTYLGFFSNGDYYSRTQYAASNEMEIFYMNLFWGTSGSGFADPLNSEMIRTLAHEFQHLINYGLRVVTKKLPRMDRWMDEGFAETAEYLAAFASNDTTTFNGRFGTRKGVYESDSANGLKNGGYGLINFEGKDENYAMANFFVMYLLGQAGYVDGNNMSDTNRVTANASVVSMFKEVLDQQAGDYNGLWNVLSSKTAFNSALRESFAKTMAYFKLATLRRSASGLTGFGSFSGLAGSGFASADTAWPGAGAPTLQPSSGSITLKPGAAVLLPYSESVVDGWGSSTAITGMGKNIIFFKVKAN